MNANSDPQMGAVAVRCPTPKEPFRQKKDVYRGRTLILLLALSLFPLYTQLAAQSSPSITVVKASQLLNPRTGNVLAPAAVLIEGDKIKQVGSPSQLSARAGVLPAAGAMKVNSKDGLTYVWIPAGAFTMGCSAGDNECFDDEKPAHEVTITKGFWIGQTLVPQVAYKRVVGTNPSRFKGEQLPVEMVSWDDAQTYCRAIGMRLPTEAEWEYAARARGTGSRYGDLDAIAWYAGNSGPQRVDGTALYQSDPKNYEEILIAKGNQTHAVGQKQANAWHLYDMIGNVWEWTADWFDKTYYTRSEAHDPIGPSNGTHRALRGGAWDDNARNNRLSNRYSLAPDSRYFYAGFRCAGE